MPKVVDHDQRRAVIVEAACAVIAAEGLEAATMRRIADSAGSTTGLVTHYFASKQAVLVAALRHVHGAAGKRMAMAVEASRPEDALRAVVCEALPLDDVRSAEWRIWLAFWAQASVDPNLRREQKSRYAEWSQLLGGLLEREGSSLHVDDLIAVLDGVGMRAALGPERFPAERQLAIVDRYLASFRPS